MIVYLCMCLLLVFHLFSLVKCLLKSFAQFLKIGLFFLLCLKSSLSSGYRSLRSVILKDFLLECNEVNHKPCLIFLIFHGAFWRGGIRAKSSVCNSSTCLVLKY